MDTGVPQRRRGRRGQRGGPLLRVEFTFASATPVEIWGHADLERRVRSLGDRPVTLIDEQLLGLGIADAIVESVAGEVLVVPPGEPALTTVAELTAEVSHRADAVVAIGGGSTIDTAKLAAAAARSKYPLADHLMARQRFPDPLPLLAIPTTAGSGAEVTKMAVVSAGSRKSWAWDEALRPAATILDADLTTTLPEPITVATGCDALVHAVEAASSQTQHAASAAAGVWAAGEIVVALPAVLADPHDTELRRRMQVASCAAGVAIDRCGVGIGHAIGHAVASLLTAPHGLLVMLGTLVAINWGVGKHPERYETVAAALGTSGTPDDVPDLIEAFANTVDYERHLAPHASNQHLDAGTLAAELPRPEHKAMWSNNAATPTEADFTWLANSVATEWLRIGRSV